MSAMAKSSDAGRKPGLRLWRRLMMFVAVGKAAVAGAGLTLAGLGALNIAFAIAAHQWVIDFQHQYIDYATGGGAAAGVLAWAWNRLA